MNKNKQSVPPQLAVPVAFTVPQAKALLHAAWFHHPPCAAYFVLRIWAGLRENEIRELDLRGLKSTQVVVGDSTRRKVELAPNVIMMLAVLRQEGRLTLESLNPAPNVVAAVIKKAGFAKKAESGGVGENKPVWMRNVMRHTALSYHFAQHVNMPLTCSWAGCCPSLVEHHYRDLINQEDAKRFWEVLPT